MASFAYSKQALQQKLANIRNQSTLAPPDYTLEQPKALSYVPPADSGLYQQNQNAAVDTYSAQVATTEQQASNRALLLQKRLAQRQLAKAKKNFVERQKQPVIHTTSVTGIPTDSGVGSIDLGSSKPGHYGKVNPYAKEVTLKFHGMHYTVNSTVANRFQGFLTALWKAGYHPSSIGGYSNRNIAGTSTRSLHSYGLAIDIDPGKNPVFYNGVGGKYALPPNVGALAAKYGLVWGGSWHHKKDYMHFSYPMFGTE